MKMVRPKFKIHITPNNMAVLLDCEVPEGELDALVEGIQGELVRLGITNPPDSETLEAWLREESKEDPVLKDARLIEGKPAVPPRDGQIIWTRDFFNKEFVTDKVTGAVDFRRRRAQVSVAQGQLLARLIPSLEGKAGRNVYGITLPVDKPHKIRVRMGANVRANKTKTAFFAETEGRICLEDGVLMVERMFVVEGNVGLESGHIIHPSALIIEGDVEEGAVVEAGGDIEIKGVLDAARVKSSGNLTVQGGITRSEKEEISVVGKLEAKFILGAAIEVQQDLFIEKEIINSRVSVKGKIEMPGGRIVGGVVSAWESMLVGQLGSDASVVTHVFAGNALGIQTHQKQIEKLEAYMEQYRETMEVLETSETKDPQMVARNMASLKQLLSKVERGEKALSMLRDELASLIEEEEQFTKPPFIQIQRKLYPGTVIHLYDQYLKIQEEYSSPVRAIFYEGEITLD